MKLRSQWYKPAASHHYGLKCRWVPVVQITMAKTVSKEVIAEIPAPPATSFEAGADQGSPLGISAEARGEKDEPQSGGDSDKVPLSVEELTPILKRQKVLCYVDERSHF